MNEIDKEAALKYHMGDKPGKIEVIPTKPYSTQRDLSLAYSPGVAAPCLEIEKDPLDAYKYTAKGNLVGVISNGTAVLGLGDIGALASKPVMEGKGLLFKIFSGVDVFDIEINETDVDKFIETVKNIAPTFGGINLEDIKAPECFEIEKRLEAELNIPVMHDDQHGTAIISTAAMINAVEIGKKDISKIKIVVNGAGASAVACTKLYMAVGVKKENIIMCDSKGVINSKRTDLNDIKKQFVTEIDIDTLEDAVKGADMFLGLSVADVLTQDMVRSMASDPIVFALANPDPEISYDEAVASREDIIFATGRSDYPNQVNNVLGFPYIFRGALDVRATHINEDMKLAAVNALVALAKEPVPDVINTAYNTARLSFGRDYIIPKALDPRLIFTVSSAVAKAAMGSGVARTTIDDWEKYEEHLADMMGYSNKSINRFYALAKANPRRVVFSEGNHTNMVKAAVFAKREAICHPTLIGNIGRINTIAQENGLSLEGIEIIGHRHILEDERRLRYAKILSDKKCRQGIQLTEAVDLMSNPNYFGMMMVETGDADALITGVYNRYSETARIALDVIGLQDGYDHFASMHIVETKKGTYFLSDTLINRWPAEETLTDIARLTDNAVKFFAKEPVIAMLSHSNFGAEDSGSPKVVSNVIKNLHEKYPEIIIDGEMQMNFALDKNLRDKIFPFNALKGKDVNTLIFPNLSSANISSKLLTELGIGGDRIGPIQLGLKKPVHFLDMESTVRDIINLTVIAVIDAACHDGGLDTHTKLR